MLAATFIQRWPDGKTTYWTEHLLKVDCWIVPDAAHLAAYYHRSLLPQDESWVLVDKTDSLRARLQATERPTSHESDFVWLNDRFVSEMEAASRHRARSDGHRYLFSMQLALTALVRMASLIAREPTTGYLPSHGFRTLEALTAIRGTEIKATGDLRGANAQLEVLARAWGELRTRARDVGLTYPNEAAACRLLDDVLRRDYFWNLRDINDGVEAEHLGRGVYRSSALAAYEGDANLDRVLAEFRIEWIADLRRPVEVEKYRYSRTPGVHSFPSWHRLDRPAGWPSDEEGRSYVGLLADMRAHVPAILELVASARPGIIHCYAGRDRTGVICALLQRIAGFSNDEILQCYSRSSEARPEALRQLLDWWAPEDVFRRLLNDLDVSPELASRVQARLNPLAQKVRVPQIASTAQEQAGVGASDVLDLAPRHRVDPA